MRLGFHSPLELCSFALQHDVTPVTEGCESRQFASSLEGLPSAMFLSCASARDSLTSLRQRCQSLGEHKCSADNVFRSRVLIRTVTVSVATGDEQHRDGSDVCDEK